MNSSGELLKKLFLSFNKGERNEFILVAKEYIEREKRKNHHVLAKQLEEALNFESNQVSNRNGCTRFKTDIPIPRDNESGFPLLSIKSYDHLWEELILPSETELILRQIVQEFKESDILRGYNLLPKSKILLCGIPGTGKTFTAQVISSVLGLPLVQIQFDAIISSYLGETATNLRKVFDFINSGIWVVLFDEFDIIGKNRDDHYEHGEIKRVVNNFLQMIDSFEGESLIFAATNHHHILDPAIWRRFDEVVLYKNPTSEDCLLLLDLFLKPIPKNGFKLESIAVKMKELAPSEIKMVAHEAMKKSILEGRFKLSKADIEFATKRFLDRKSIKNGKDG
ncbi:AAA family ATPase [Desulfatibacillum aliphaticivorans]|uniref:AAA ATPase central domain protein n=1 Tax=Desulfatibacillum aliphaticivorans TaxID=218208 RepID=B8FF82_DESAL|nr:ATP-binding protein [Desulfatibacillum aliphaticivorans]ACL03899.1 AAA ATPase central domain protein [Desulfatibacillum aliphaticivorans]